MRWVGMIETQYDLTHTTTPSGRQSTNGKIKPQLQRFFPKREGSEAHIGLPSLEALHRKQDPRICGSEG